jgi:hypothetical protein
MGFAHINRLTLIAPFVAGMLTFAPTMARAELLTLKCAYSGSESSPVIYSIDLAARTVIRRWAGETKMTNVAISDSTISFVWDVPRVDRWSSQIDRTTGQMVTEIYFYPGSGRSGDQRPVGQCTKIPNKAF